MKILFKLSIFSLLMIFVISCNSSDQKKKNTNSEKKRVAIVLPVSIDAFDELIKGIRESTQDKLDIKIYSAEGDLSKFETVIQSALLNKPDYLITIGTQITNSAFGPQFKNHLPIVIAAAISSPELVESLVTIGLNPRRNSEVAIVSDSPKESIYILFSKALKLFLPSATKVGIIYNPGEINSIGTSSKIGQELKKNGIVIIDGVINSADDIEKIVDKLLLQNVNAIIIPHDKNAVTKASSIVKKCDEKNIPVFSLEDGTVKKDGVSIGISVNYKIIGDLIGQCLLSINEGKTMASEMPIISVENGMIYVNDKKMKSLGINIPDSLRSVIQTINE